MSISALSAYHAAPAFLSGRSRSWVRMLRWAFGVFIFSAGCSSAPKISDNWVDNLDNSDPQVRMEAICRVARGHDAAAIPKLIALLDDDEVSIRFAANSALEKMTETDMAYRAYDTLQARNEAAGRWRAWWDKEQSTWK